MTVPPNHDREHGPDETPPLDFDPYRFGKPDHPIPPEYAPPGYVPPAPAPPVAPTPQYPYAYPPPPGAYPYGAPKPGNGKATVALVLGILSLVFCWLSVLDLALSVPAIVLGALGRSDATRFPERGGRGSATAGLICGMVAIVLAIALTVFAYTRVKPCIDNYSINSSDYNQCVHDRLFG